MTTLIEGGTVVTLGGSNKIIYPGGVVIEGQNVIDVGLLEELKIKYSSADVLDAKGKIIMPALVNTHHHLYSTFARGLNVPGKPPKTFTEILESLWWKLDRALFREAIYFSSIIPLIECARHGVTAVIDHHESQSYQIGSLDEIKRAVEKMGMRAVLCLGTSDRYGNGERGIEENERFLRKETSNVKGMVGLHASFTVEQETLEKSVRLAQDFNVGIHVHCAEDGSDQTVTRERYGKNSVVERFRDAGALSEKSILVHCIHISDEEMNMIADSGSSVVHNPESNMNNAVGYSKILDMYSGGIDVGIGTDGMSSDVMGQMRSAFLLARHCYKDPTVGFMEVPEMLLKVNPKILNKVTGWDLGEISKGSAADIITVDYNPATPLDENNLFGHLLFGIVNSPVDTTICNGRTIMRHKKITCLDEAEIYVRAREIARKVWERIK